MLQKLTQLAQKNTHIVIGLTSGTSADGVDAALCEISGEGRGGLKVKLVAKYSEPYPDFIRDRVIAAADVKGGNSAELCELNFLIGEMFAQTAQALLQEAGVDTKSVDLIGSHGQTVSHIPPRTESHSFQLGSTLQLGEPAVLAERLGVPVISNFHTRDMAAGGQGAPLGPYVDYLLFSSESASRMTVNIGGVSTVTWLPPHGKLDDTIAFDSGPGSIVIDSMVNYMTQGNQTYDADGMLAESGTINKMLLEEMLQHDYLLRPPPKSTGRSDFGIEYAIQTYERGTRRNVMPRDIIATATAFVAQSITQSIKQFVLPKGSIDEMIVSGGGVYNPILMKHVQAELPAVKIARSDDFGIPIKAKESITFAVLARETLLDRPSNLPVATGAGGYRLLGQYTPA